MGKSGSSFIYVNNLWDVLQSGCVHVSKVWRVADLSLTGPLALPFAFFHCLDTPVLPHFISPHISFTPNISITLITNTFTIPSQTPSHPTVPLTDPLTDPLTPHSSAHRSPYRPPHTSQISHRFWSQISHWFLTDLSWLPRVSPWHPTSRKLPQCFSTLVYHRSSRVLWLVAENCNFT